MHIHKHPCESIPKFTNMQSLSSILQVGISNLHAQCKPKPHYLYSFQCLEMSLYHMFIFIMIFYLYLWLQWLLWINAEILRFIGHLREIGSTWRGGDELRCSLSDSLLSIVDTIARSNDALYSIASYRERKRKQYVDGLSYNEVKKLKITKQAIYSLFRLPGTDNIPDISRPHISIEWCTFPPIRDN